MTKTEFLKQLKKKLRMLPEQERQRVLDYYNELIEDEMEEGHSEADAVSRRGSIADIAEQTLREYVRDHGTAEKGTEGNVLPRSGFGKRLTITIISFPLWLPLYATGWSVLVSLFAAALSCVLAGIVRLIPSLLIATTDGAAGWFQVGICITALGFGVLLAFGSWELTRLWLKMSRWLCRGIRYSFHKERVDI